MSFTSRKPRGFSYSFVWVRGPPQGTLDAFKEGYHQFAVPREPMGMIHSETQQVARHRRWRAWDKKLTRMGKWLHCQQEAWRLQSLNNLASQGAPGWVRVTVDTSVGTQGAGVRPV